MMKIGAGRRITLGLVLATGLAACARVVAVEQPCAYLRNHVCGRLATAQAPGEFSSVAVIGSGDSVVTRRYLDPDAEWTRYEKVLVGPVQFVPGEHTALSQADQMTLTSCFRKILHEQLAQELEVVDAPGRT